MPQYQFETQLVISPDANSIVLAGAQVTLYDPSDLALASPITLTDPNGLPMLNPLTASAQGFIPAFAASIPQVMWSGGGFVGYIGSFKSVLDAARAAAQAAQDAVTGAAGAIPAGGTDGQVLTKNGSTNYATRWAAASGGGSVAPGDVDTIVGNLVSGGTGASVGALDNRYKKKGIVPIDDLPAGSSIVVRKTGASWPARPTSRTDIIVIWVGLDPDPAIITSGTAGAMNNVDVRMAI